ncbi:hypothetical protein [Ammoniphilus sp. CFH 90114]|uniref:hypothetical protein n=1 Tax=Ammoniphilus sp. CFH 90114 TaxID=2493665 RepID=UPI00100F1BE1|nr:hypothetical protein [Ammoniphilus sp. CFH 90114]RXT06263.1 hypothetical protein EIZ39_14335 [Ammoniphilus sp. CFH 90114]
MTTTKPWIMYESKEEIGKTIQEGLAEKLLLPVGFSLEEEGFLFIIQLPGNQAHIRCTLKDLKDMYPNADEFVNFIASCWQESLDGAAKDA